ncbi:MAG TPA: hypothetical protein VE089_09205 [Nitrososphaeraceae archaeon]|nr:hypothetical protein [Nitrososphaeraceae archaeon]
MRTELINSTLNVIDTMEDKDIETIKAKSEQATCELCGLTARTRLELDDHIRHAHGDSRQDKYPSTQ